MSLKKAELEEIVKRQAAEIALLKAERTLRVEVENLPFSSLAGCLGPVIERQVTITIEYQDKVYTFHCAPTEVRSNV